MMSNFHKKFELKIPRHIAVIMDGNGRWAKARNLPRTAGHKKGAEAVRRIVEAACEIGLSYLTLFAFSSENWNRSKTEVSILMQLLKNYIIKEIPELDRQGVRVSFIGDRTKLSSDIVSEMEAAEAKTSKNDKLNLIIALSYGAREEILAGVKSIISDVGNGSLLIDKLDENEFSKRLYTKDIPDPDVVIRTSGEKRISNFLLWQVAYAEFVFADVLWPDFSKENLIAAIEEYSKRERRYGKETA
ncbi:MAG: isoprenyl transferase [Alphaproteobacteria bacterium]